MRLAGLALPSWAKLHRFLDKAHESPAFAAPGAVKECRPAYNCQADRPVYKQ